MDTLLRRTFEHTKVSTLPGEGRSGEGGGGFGVGLYQVTSENVSRQ